MKKIVLAITMSLNVVGLLACSCFGPQTFCGTLDPQPPEFPEPEWWIPDAVILGVKVAQEAHGMDVEVVEVISGDVQAGDILRVWGDCGLLCRIYPDVWEVGDTVVWSIRYTDLMGNGLCGTSLEQEGEFMISICGIYYLEYENGIVSGPIAEGVDQLPYADLVQYLATCGATSITTINEDPDLEYAITDDHLNITSTGFGPGPVDHLLLDAQGKILAQRSSANGSTRIPITGIVTGVHVLRISDGRHSKVLRLFIP